jgi:SAM-dependent methyltransferase
MAHEHHHHGDQVHLGEDEWRALAEQAEREGEAFLAFVTEATAWVDEQRGPDAGPVRRILDVGSGPGVGSCEWAERFPDADVVAIDGSAAMLQRAAARARARGLDQRVRTHHAELPGGLSPFAGTADVVWVSMALHHVGDEVAALRELGSCLAPGGLLVIAEFGDPTELMPAEVGVGRPGLADRLGQASEAWFAAMRNGLPGSTESAELEDMVRAAGLDIVGSRRRRIRVDAPLDPAMRTVLQGILGRVREYVADRADPDDVAALDVLLDERDPRCLLDRPDAFVEVSRLLVVARAAR